MQDNPIERENESDCTKSEESAKKERIMEIDEKNEKIVESKSTDQDNWWKRPV